MIEHVIDAAAPRSGRIRGGTRAAARSAAWSVRSCSSITWARSSSRRATARSADVRPHPHIGLATVTYLFDGEIMHRDSLGSEQAIRPGEVNWMTAGRGITHSERFERARRNGERMHGIQAWVALPREHEEMRARVSPLDAADLPTYQGGGLWARLVAGEAYGARAPFPVPSPLFYVHWSLAAGARADLEPSYPERAAYIAAGSVEVAGRRFDAGQMHRLRARRAGRVHGAHRRHRDAGGRRADRRTLHRVELRVLVARADRAGEGGLEGRADEAARARRHGVHSASARPRLIVIPVPPRIG